MVKEPIPTDWVRAALPLAVLGSLATHEAHGYELLRTLHEGGFESVTGGTLYPLLGRQQDLGRVQHRWEHPDSGPGRKVFFLTEQGRADLTELRPQWSHLDTIVRNLAGENTRG